MVSNSIGRCDDRHTVYINSQCIIQVCIDEIVQYVNIADDILSENDLYRNCESEANNALKPEEQIVLMEFVTACRSTCKLRTTLKSMPETNDYDYTIRIPPQFG